MTVFFTSDHHFGHKNVINFGRSDGTLLRPFDTLDDMHRHIVEQHNATVRRTDAVYFLGDVAFNKAGLEWVGHMNGVKSLIRGNHDHLTHSLYEPFFNSVVAYKEFEGVIASHIPLHPDCVERFGINVHGHLHDKLLSKPYYNVSVEATGYTPVSLDQIRNWGKHSLK